MSPGQLQVSTVLQVADDLQSLVQVEPGISWGHRVELTRERERERERDRERERGRGRERERERERRGRSDRKQVISRWAQQKREFSSSSGVGGFTENLCLIALLADVSWLANVFV